MSASSPHQHETVLLEEAVDALVRNADGTYVDCTYGRGGHTRLILERLSSRGRLMIIDKDAEAIADAAARFTDEPRLIPVQGSFRSIAGFVAQHDLGMLDGVLIDLGVSSPQLDEATRGFSFSKPGPLDMRMDQTRGQTAADWLNTAEEVEIKTVIRRYGEEKFARRIASAVVEARQEQPLVTTEALVALIEAAVPRREKHKHPATRTFQAIRIFINDELADLEAALEAIVPLLAPGGRLVVIAFHSLEDRIVKRFMRDQARGELLPSRLPIRDAAIRRDLKLVGKATKPSSAEVARNRRARSSIMRVAERTS